MKYSIEQISNLSIKIKQNTNFVIMNIKIGYIDVHLDALGNSQDWHEQSPQLRGTDPIISFSVTGFIDFLTVLASYCSVCKA